MHNIGNRIDWLLLSVALIPVSEPTNAENTAESSSAAIQPDTHDPKGIEPIISQTSTEVHTDIPGSEQTTAVSSDIPKDSTETGVTSDTNKEQGTVS